MTIDSMNLKAPIEKASDADFLSAASYTTPRDAANDRRH